MPQAENCKNKTPDNETLKWYMERAQADEHSSIAGLEKRIHFLSGLNIAVLTLVGAGAIHADEWYEYLILMLGPVFMWVTDKGAWDGCYRYYVRFTDAIIVKAHIEQALGLTRPLEVPPHEGAYWTEEPPIPSRHLDPRRRHGRSSVEWRSQVEHEGTERWVRWLFLWYRGIALALIVVLSLAALSAGA